MSAAATQRVCPLEPVPATPPVRYALCTACNHVRKSNRPCLMVEAPAPATHRGLRLTGRAYGLLEADERRTPADVFPPEVYAELRRCGLDVFFIRADSLLGVAS